ncbi:right-handed parallel beta-helix repeat-containing protein [candidate division KSB1 bacterium]|nr:right-handed parallel beta-helix repeat-containing protein [candidate division KSB1 bacterium]MBL7094258.1 right-handed parallel beta-helix repeat-containing protein [candidate division KSB1 bacterium]
MKNTNQNMMHKLYLIIFQNLFSVLVLFLFVLPIHATTYYVSPSGSNSNPGTAESPWATPGYASRQLGAGDVLIIKGGTYSLSQFDADIITPSSGSSGAWITIKGEEGNRPTLAGSNNLMVAINLAGKNYIRIENLEITSDNGATFRDGISAVGGAANNIVFENLYIHHLDEFGIDLGDVQHVDILNCDITYCGFGSVGGPTGESGGWRNVLISGCDLSYGGHYYQGGPGPSPYGRPDGFGIEPSSGPIEIKNTTVEHNRGDGLDSKAQNTNIHECYVANNFADGIKLWGTGSKIKNTLIYGRGDGNTVTTPWAAIVIDTEGSGASFEITNVTIDDYVGKNYVMYVQYDHQSTPINLVCRNTIFSSRGSNAAIYLANSVNRTFEYNLYYFPNSYAVLIHGGTNYDSEHVADIGAGNIYGDPLFESPAFGSTGNYHIRDGSPAINGGTANGAPSKDLDGRNRPIGDVYDIGCYESTSLVPVELVSFEARIKNQNVELFWETISESNNYGFEIQRGRTADSFSKIGFVAGKGTTLIHRDYYFVDKKAVTGNLFYRLKQMDFDGSFTLSNVAHVNIAPPSKFFLGQNYPNPFNSSTIIPFSVSKKTHLKITLHNIQGEEIQVLTDQVYDGGFYQITLNVQNLSTGLYFYKLSTEDLSITRKTVVVF